MNLTSKSDLDSIMAVVDGLKKDQWRHVLQRLSPDGMAELRNAVADSFQFVADFVRGAEPKAEAAKARGAGAG